ncbi:MAG: beta-1,6-galactofuranosyltransferase [Geminocystis sp.]|nr:beta-1,6-galactofuranosyltransferase [Geminocystis sp.]
MTDDITMLFEYQIQLRRKLKKILRKLEAIQTSREYDFIVCHCEVNQRQGVGILLKRLFPDKQKIVSVRSHNLYDGKEDFARFSFLISHDNHKDISAAISKIQSLITNIKPRRILAIPYFPDDVINAIAIKRLFEVPLCTYIMDDQNIYAKGIPDELMKELISNSDLCLGVSREICREYGEKYNRKFWFLPPVAPASLVVDTDVVMPSGDNKHGIIIGNIWSQQWLEELRKTVRSSGIPIHWYGNPNREWLSFNEKELAADGIIFHGYLAEEELVGRLREASFAVIPTASEFNPQQRQEIARLSLPSRIPFIVATSHTPILVIGNPDTAAARFVRQHQLGTVCQYDTQQFQKTVAWLTEKETQLYIRKNALKLAATFSSQGVEEWIWQSLKEKHPFDQRFEKLGRLLKDATVVITHNEVNHKHGTGVLVKRIIADTPNIYSIRTDNHYSGLHNFGDVSYCLPHKGITRIQAYKLTIELLEDITVKRGFCVPYYPDDLLLSIALKDIFNVPLGVYIMDDQNIVLNKIPDDLMAEFLSKCDLRLATHPELRDAYQGKYNLPFYILPAVVPHHLINTTPATPDEKLLNAKIGALIGSIWSPHWFEMLSNTVTGAKIRLDWYGNYSYNWLIESPEEIRQKRGLNPYGVVTEEELAGKLKQYPYVVVPTGTLDRRDDRPELSRLSLPGRIIFAACVGNTPIIVMGNENTPAANFVKHFGIGVVCDYNSDSFLAAVDYIIQPQTQEAMRTKASKIAPNFSAKDIHYWLWESLSQGKVADLRFETLFSSYYNS